jgi:hypothetical protein
MLQVEVTAIRGEEEEEEEEEDLILLPVATLAAYMYALYTYKH